MYPSTPRSRTVAVISLVVALLLLACGEPLAPLSASGGELRERRTVLQMAITPGNHLAYVGDQVQFAVTVTSSSYIVQPATTVSWSSSDTRVARIEADGRLTAVAAGTATVRAATYGMTASVPVTVVASGGGTPATIPPSSGSEPVFNPAVHRSLWGDDFESSTSTASIYARYATQNGESGIHLDASGGRGGSKGLRIDWQPRAGCNDDSHFIEGSFPAAQEVVVQYSVRYQANFAFDWIGRGGACSGNAKKLFFLWAAAGSRFDFISENHALGVGSDHDHPLFAQNLGAAVTPEMWGNGQWHRITLRVRQSSTPTATDGYIHGWIDGVQKWSVNHIASNASGGWVLFKLPTTFNQGSPVAQSEWMDDFRIWRP